MRQMTMKTSRGESALLSSATTRIRTLQHDDRLFGDALQFRTFSRQTLFWVVVLRNQRQWGFIFSHKNLKSIAHGRIRNVIATNASKCDRRGVHLLMRLEIGRGGITSAIKRSANARHNKDIVQYTRRHGGRVLGQVNWNHVTLINSLSNWNGRGNKRKWKSLPKTNGTPSISNYLLNKREPNSLSISMAR